MIKYLFYFLILLLLSPGIMAQESEKWNFPIRPGTEEWTKLDNLSDRLSAYNIPEKQLTSMSTQHLVEACLEYPELRMIMTRNTYQKGYNFIRSNFNGFIELEKRNDAGRALLSKYSKVKHDDVSAFSEFADKGRFILNILYLEIIISQDLILINMEKPDLLSLKNHAIRSFENKDRLNEDFGVLMLETPSLIMAKILKIENENNPSPLIKLDDEIVNFIKMPEKENFSVWTRVYEISKSNL